MGYGQFVQFDTEMVRALWKGKGSLGRVRRRSQVAYVIPPHYPERPPVALDFPNSGVTVTQVLPHRGSQFGAQSP
jgi:hypothetical protein